MASEYWSWVVERMEFGVVEKRLQVLKCIDSNMEIEK